MLKGSCEQAQDEKEQIAARIEAEREKIFVLWHNIRALENEISERLASHRGDYEAVEVVVSDFWAQYVAATEFVVAKWAATEESQKEARENGRGTKSVSTAEMLAADFELPEEAAAEGAKKIITDFWAAKAVALSFGAVDDFAADFGVAEMLDAK